jgi:hypothetical protein
VTALKMRAVLQAIVVVVVLVATAVAWRASPGGTGPHQMTMSPMGVPNGVVSCHYDETSSSDVSASSIIRNPVPGATLPATSGRGTRLAPEAASELRLATSESWGDPATLADHFARHGADFGATSPDEYAAQASSFLQRSQAEGLPTKIDSRGVIRTYDPNTNEFGAFNASGTTRTYYAPDPAVHGYASNWDYWLAQPGSEPWTP